MARTCLVIITCLSTTRQVTAFNAHGFGLKLKIILVWPKGQKSCIQDWSPWTQPTTHPPPAFPMTPPGYTHVKRNTTPTSSSPSRRTPLAASPPISCWTLSSAASTKTTSGNPKQFLMYVNQNSSNHDPCLHQLQIDKWRTSMIIGRTCLVDTKKHSSFIAFHRKLLDFNFRINVY